MSPTIQTPWRIFTWSGVNVSRKLLLPSPLKRSLEPSRMTLDSRICADMDDRPSVSRKSTDTMSCHSSLNASTNTDLSSMQVADSSDGAGLFTSSAGRGSPSLGSLMIGVWLPLPNWST